MKFNEFLSELRQALTLPTKGSLVKAILLLLAILLVALGLSYLLLHFFPAEKLERFSQYGYLGIFLLTLICSFTIIFPLPGTIVVISAAAIWNTALIALVASIGGALGEITGYYAGYLGRAVIAPEHSERYQVAEGWMRRHGGWTIFLFAFFPFLIFDFVGIAAGVFRYPIKKFLLFCWAGRLPRSFIECYIGAGLLNLILHHLPF